MTFTRQDMLPSQTIDIPGLELGEYVLLRGNAHRARTARSGTLKWGHLTHLSIQHEMLLFEEFDEEILC